MFSNGCVGGSRISQAQGEYQALWPAASSAERIFLNGITKIIKSQTLINMTGCFSFKKDNILLHDSLQRRSEQRPWLLTSETEYV
jgi:hypothetical protein